MENLLAKHRKPKLEQINGIAPSVSSLEEKRLAELYEYDILDTPKDKEFDSLATIAARIYDVPVAQINFIDRDRQWSKTSLGVEMEEIPRDVSLCNLTIQQNRFLLVPDTMDHDQMKNSPFVTEDPNVRFYAGVAIKGSRGHNIGSMCVVDVKPRDISEKDLETLQILASEVEARLNLHKRNRELRESNEHLEQTATFLHNSADLMLRINPPLFQIIGINTGVEDHLGFNADNLTGKPLTVLAPGTEFLGALNRWSDEGSKGLFTHETTLKNSNGEPHWFSIQVSLHNGEWYATARNIDQRRQIQEKYRETVKILKNAQRIARVGHWNWYPQEERLVWSDELHQIMGTDPDRFEGTVSAFMELVHPDDRHILETVTQRILGGGSLEPYEHRCVLHDGTLLHVTERGEVTRDENGNTVRVSGITQDITAAKEAEEKLLESLHEKELMLAEIHHRVKNVIALISGMLQLEQFNAEENGETESPVLDSILSRLQSMAVVHNNLYQADSFTSVPVGSLMKELVEIASGTINQPETPIVVVEAEDVSLNINQAVPFALAVNHTIYTGINRHGSPAGMELSEHDGLVTLTVTTSVGTDKNSADSTADSDSCTCSTSTQIFETLMSQLGAEYHCTETNNDHILTVEFSKSNDSGSSAGTFFGGAKK